MLCKYRIIWFKDAYTEWTKTYSTNLTKYCQNIASHSNIKLITHKKNCQASVGYISENQSGFNGVLQGYLWLYNLNDIITKFNHKILACQHYFYHYISLCWSKVRCCVFSNFMVQGDSNIFQESIPHHPENVFQKLVQFFRCSSVISVYYSEIYLSANYRK